MKRFLRRFLYYFIGLIISIGVVYLAYYLVKTLIRFKEPSEKIIIKDSVKIDTQYIPTSNILFITQDKVDLKEEPVQSSNTLDILQKNSIFYIIQKGKIDRIRFKGKDIEDFWYEVTDNNENSGWVFGYYTSKSIR